MRPQWVKNCVRSPWVENLRWCCVRFSHEWRQNKDADTCAPLRVEEVICVLPDGLRWKYWYYILLVNQMRWLVDLWIVFEYYLLINGWLSWIGWRRDFILLWIDNCFVVVVLTLHLVRNWWFLRCWILILFIWNFFDG